MSLKTGFAQIIFLLLPKNSELPKLWGGSSPPHPPGLYAYVHKTPSIIPALWMEPATSYSSNLLT